MNKLSIFICLLLFLGCKETSKNKTVNEITVFRDVKFQDGIGISGVSTVEPQNQDTITPFGTGSGKPIWRIAQWGTKFNLAGTEPQRSGEVTSYSNEGKKVEFAKVGDDVSVSLYVYASKEYPEPRKEGESWPHLLLEQPLEMSVNLNELSQLLYKVNARLLFADMKMTEQQFDPSLHTCQVTLYLTVQNRNKQSSSYGDYFWFGLPLYDFRNRYIAEYAALDGGQPGATNKFINTLQSALLFEGTLHDKQWISISKDVYPFIKSAFNKAQTNGYMQGTKFEDLTLGSMNVGWEVPGTFDCGMELKGLSLTGITK